MVTGESQRPLKAFLAAGTDPRALTWPTMLVTLWAFLVLSLVQFQMNLIALFGSIVAWGLQWVAMWLVNTMFLARRWSRRHPLVGASTLFLIIVVAAGLIAALFNESADGYTVLWRFVLSLVVAALWLRFVEYRATSEAEATVQQALTEARDYGSIVLQREREQVVTGLIDSLHDTLARPVNSGFGASTQLRQFARDRVRPLSHELMESLPPTVQMRATKAQSVTVRQVLERVTSVSLMPPLLTAIVVTFAFIWRTVAVNSEPELQPATSGIEVTVDLRSLLWSFAGLAVVFLVAFGSAWLVRRVSEPLLPRLGLWRRLALAVAGLIVIALAIEAAIQLAYLTPIGGATLRSGFIDRFVLAIPIVAIAFLVVASRALSQLIVATREHQAQLTADLAWEVARVNETLHQERRFFAMQTHGPLQSAAAAAAARLESLPESASVEQAWSAVYRDLEGAIRELVSGPSQARDVAEEISGLAAAWRGVCEIEVDLALEVLTVLDSDWIAAASVAEVVTEAIGNAAMHGSATHIHIRIECSVPDVVEIEVINNGDALPEEPVGGLGTSVFEDLCIEWGRMNTDDGVRVWAQIPVAVGATRSPA